VNKGKDNIAMDVKETTLMNMRNERNLINLQFLDKRNPTRYLVENDE
jgi:hypothetical protein